MSLSDIFDDPQFQAQGYAVVPELFDRKSADLLGDLIELYVRPTPDNDGVLVADGIMSDRDDTKTLSSDAESLVSDLRGKTSGMAIMHDQMIAKIANRKLNAPWHQDHVAYAGESKLTLFIVAGPDASDGLEVIPGSHLNGPLTHTRKVLPDLPAETRAQAVRVEVKPGSVLALHPHTIHRGLDNRGGATSKTYTLMLKDMADPA